MPATIAGMGEPDALDDPATGGWYRRTIGRRIERGVNGAFGVLFVLIGMFVLSLGDDWPARIFAGAMWGLAWLSFRARSSIVEGFGEEPPGGPRSWQKRRAARRP